ncbi:hypothetical protein HDU98_001856 [Podochytrium sp. JEL0797]|nr:hypothetical protein HDU98_001856 [Podochytrium sp. JEL0797]
MTHFKTTVQSTISALETQVQFLSQEAREAQREAGRYREVAETAQQELSKKMAEPPIVDPDTVAVDFDKTIQPHLDRVKQLEFENNRLKGTEVALEGLIAEWKGENQTLRRMVDELSGGGGSVSGVVDETLRKEVSRLGMELEDERLKFAKAKEVIRSLKGEIRGGAEMDQEGEGCLDVEGLALESGLRFGDKSVLSSHVKALHDTVTKSLVDFDELVKVIGENTELKARVSESAIRLEEQEKRLLLALTDSQTLSKTLQDTTHAHETTLHTLKATHKTALHTLETTLHTLQSKHKDTTTLLDRLQLESNHFRSLTASYTSQISRIQQLASEWFDTKSEHSLQSETTWMHPHQHQQQETENLPARINFEGHVMRLIAILKETRDKLVHSQEAVKKLTTEVHDVSQRERHLTGQCKTQEKELKTLNVKCNELETELDQESRGRLVGETRLRKVIRASMMLLEIPVEEAVLARILPPGSRAGSPQKRSVAARKNQGLSSPSRDFQNDQ